ncbi:MAG TPA: MFS transporter [Methylomirabilota bacterium]|jgi:MFS family permease|nr:MFS transporter [Methylomirabilota bacterium]
MSTSERAIVEAAPGQGRAGDVARRPQAVLGLACSAHFIHDGFADILYVLLPIWAREFDLAFVQVGAIRTVYSGAMALFQVPAGLLAERWGERRLLALGTALTGAGFVAAGWAGGFASLLAVLLIAGLASGVQHPLASTLVSTAYETGRRRVALGTYNFSGDLGKMAMPAAVGLIAAVVGWRAASAAAGAVGILAAAAIFLVLIQLAAGGRAPSGERPAGGGWGIRHRGAFAALSAVGMIDSGTRTAFLTFLPFVLIAKGLTTAHVGVALALLFAGGAVGKFVCGLAAERIGVIRAVILTEVITAIGIATVVYAPLAIALAVLAPLGIALNGTSSVLYGTVADLVLPERRSRSYGLYYTMILGASALSPTVYGVVSDAAGVTPTLLLVAALVLLTVPLAASLGRALADSRAQ